MEGERGQDRGLGGGVEALDVGGRVGLGVAERLRLLDGLGETGAGRVHLVEHVVGGAVDDAEHPADVVAGQRLAQRAQQRDGAGDGGLVVEVDAVLGGRGVEGRAVLGEQRLVGGDDEAPCSMARRIRRAGRLDAADHLDDDVGPGDQLLGVGGEQRRVDAGGRSGPGRRGARRCRRAPAGAPTRAARSSACSVSRRATARADDAAARAGRRAAAAARSLTRAAPPARRRNPCRPARVHVLDGHCSAIRTIGGATPTAVASVQSRRRGRAGPRSSRGAR